MHIHVPQKEGKIKYQATDADFSQVTTLCSPSIAPFTQSVQGGNVAPRQSV